eukprot:gene27633-33371_t
MPPKPQNEEKKPPKIIRFSATYPVVVPYEMVKQAVLSLSPGSSIKVVKRGGQTICLVDLKYRWISNPAKLVVNGHTPRSREVSEADDDDESKAASAIIQAVPYDRTTFRRHNPPGCDDEWRSLLIHCRGSLGKKSWAMAHLECPLVVRKKSDLNFFVTGTHRSILFLHPTFLTKMSYDELTGFFCSFEYDYYYGPKNLLIPAYTRKVVVSRWPFKRIFNEDEDCENDNLLQEAFVHWHVRNLLYEVQEEDVAADSDLGAADEAIEDVAADEAIEAGAADEAIEAGAADEAIYTGKRRCPFDLPE